MGSIEGEFYMSTSTKTPTLTRLRRRGPKAGTARRMHRVLEAMAYSRRIEELETEARYRARHDLYRTQTHGPSPRASRDAS